MTKKEKKLIKAAQKLEKITKKYMEQLTEVDEVMQKMPRQIVSCYELEDRYFRHVPTIASIAVKMELLASHLEEATRDDSYPAEFNEQELEDIFGETGPDDYKPSEW